MVDLIKLKVDFLLAVFLCGILLPGSAGAQTDSENYLMINRLTRETGLPDQDVNGIFFDGKGYAWISTFGGGLVRYDGDSYIKFSKYDTPGFTSDIVNQCCEDGFDRLWIPNAGGLDIMDLNTLSMIDDCPGMSKEWRRSHSSGPVSRDAKGCMWFTSNDVLFRVALEDDGNRFIVDSLECRLTNVNLMPNACDVDNDGSSWITLDGNFFKVRYIEDKGLCMSEILPSINIGEDNKATAYLRNGNDVWIGTLKGLYRVDIVSGDYTCYQHSESDSHSLPNDEITGLCFSPEGEVAAGTLGGVAIYNSVSQTFSTYRSRANGYGNKILPGEMVRCLVTRNRQIWVGLEAEGLAIIQRKALQITNLSYIECKPALIPSAPVRTLFIDSDDNLWLAVTEYGLCRQVGDLLFRNYTTSNSALSDNSITAFCEDGHGRIWLGTVNGRMNYINMSSPDVIHLPDGNKSEVARSIDVIISMNYDCVNDYIWIMARNGLYVYDLERARYTKYPGIMTSCLGSCISSKKLWVSCLEGMCIIDLKTHEFRMIDDFPFSMAVVPDGDTIWAGTYGKGIYRLDNGLGEHPDITVYSEEEGLADSQINGLMLDGNHLWITTENGLSCLDTQVGEITSYGIKDGLKSMAFCENSIAKGRNGTIYLGQKEGLSILQSSYVPNEYLNKPDVVISGYYSGNMFHDLSFTDTINKDEKDTDFTLKFSDLSYSTGTDISYESRILPMEKTWSPIFENDTHIKFGRIPGGNYRIQIRAVDKNGNVLSQDERFLDVRPVFYKRWWSLLLFALLAVLLGCYVFRMYTRSITQKKDLLQQEVNRQTKILQDQKVELEKKAEKLAEQNSLLQRQNEMIASHNTLLSSTLQKRCADFSYELLEAIQKKYKDPDLDVRTLAEAMGMSRSVLNDRIQQTLGMSIAQFIRTYRLNVAKEMIQSGANNNMNISEIAYEVGFNDPKYFTRCFTKEFNITPSEMQRSK